MEATTDTAVETAPESVEEVVADATVETSDTTDSQEEASFYYDADTPATGEVPEWFKTSKYKTIADQAKAYIGLESKLGGFIGAPESGEYEITPAEGVAPEVVEGMLSSEVFGKLQELGAKNGMSNDFMNEFVNTYLSSKQQETEAQLAAEVASLGKDADRRIAAINDKLSTVLEGELLTAVQNSMTTAKAVEGIEAILNKNVNTVAPSDETATNPDIESELDNLWTAVDDRGRRKMEYDAAYRNMVNKKFRDYYGD